MLSPASRYYGYRFPPEIVAHAVWLEQAPDTLPANKKKDPGYTGICRDIVGCDPPSVVARREVASEMDPGVSRHIPDRFFVRDVRAPHAGQSSGPDHRAYDPAARARRPDLSPIVDTPRNTPYFNDPKTPGNRDLKAI